MTQPAQPGPIPQAPATHGTAAAPGNADAKSSRRILVVEDEVALALGVRDALRHVGHTVEVCHNGAQALELLRREPFDLAVLDLMLPQMNGFEVLQRLRQENQRVRIVILTALSGEEDVIRGFELGADDYVQKPFSPRELVARVDAQFRRLSSASEPPPMLQLPGGITVDFARLEVHRDGASLALTPREGDILEYLIRNRDKVVTREDLLLDVWHYRNPNVATRTVDIHIVGLRRKIEPDPANPTLIQTVRGKGYRWFN